MYLDMVLGAVYVNRQALFSGQMFLITSLFPDRKCNTFFDGHRVSEKGIKEFRQNLGGKVSYLYFCILFLKEIDLKKA